jgi:glycine cleavage system H protein
MAEPKNVYYSKEHEWVRVEGDTAVVGITEYAQSALGDIVFVELPRPGSPAEQFGNIGVVESVKSVSDLFTPVGGAIVEINPAIDVDPALVNREPYGAGWLFKVRLTDQAQLGKLLTAAQYEEFVAASG